VRKTANTRKVKNINSKIEAEKKKLAKDKDGAHQIAEEPRSQEQSMLNQSKVASDKDLEEAAVKIQSVFKGKKTRQKLKEKQKDKELEKAAVKI